VKPPTKQIQIEEKPMSGNETESFIDNLKEQLANAPEGMDTSGLADALKKLAEPGEDRVKIWFLLDRSGSMQGLSEDVIGGFNQFLTDQAAKPGKARLTAVQFDGGDPFEVIIDAKRIGKVPKLTSEVYQPRGVTPLYDAVGKLIASADQRIAHRKETDWPEEDQLVIVFTDGLENASRKFNRRKVFDLITDRMNSGWTFVFMGANQDSYAEGHKIGLVDGNVQNYAATPESVKVAFSSVSRASVEFRNKNRTQRVRDRDDFFGGVKEAER
jgi:Mg-chelatase subunit ChlD